jgi:membrane protein
LLNDGVWMKGFFNLAKKTLSEWSEDNASRLAASLSYYTTFSLAPLLVLLISLLGLFGVSERIREQINNQVSDLAGEQGAELIGSMIDTATLPSAGILTTVIGVVTLLFGAIGVFNELQNSLNTIWEVKPKPREGILGTIRNLFLTRLISFAMILVIGFLLLVSLVLSAVLSTFGEFLENTFLFSEFLIQLINFIVSFGVITVLFALIYKYLPDAEIAWKDVWLGAAITALLFTAGKLLIGLYLGNTNIGNAFGAAGSLAILMIWVYYSAQIVFLGAEFTQVYANMYGSRIVPSEDAVHVTEEERAQQGIPRREQVAARAEETGKQEWSPGYQPQTSPGTTFVSRSGRAMREQGFLGKAIFFLIMVFQFIPVLRKTYASKTK